MMNNFRPYGLSIVFALACLFLPRAFADTSASASPLDAKEAKIAKAAYEAAHKDGPPAYQLRKIRSDNLTGYIQRDFDDKYRSPESLKALAKAKDENDFEAYKPLIDYYAIVDTPKALALLEELSKRNFDGKIGFYRRIMMMEENPEVLDKCRELLIEEFEGKDPKTVRKIIYGEARENIWKDFTKGERRKKYEDIVKSVEESSEMDDIILFLYGAWYDLFGESVPHEMDVYEKYAKMAIDADNAPLALAVFMVSTQPCAFGCIHEIMDLDLMKKLIPIAEREFLNGTNLDAAGRFFDVGEKFLKDENFSNKWLVNAAYLGNEGCLAELYVRVFTGTGGFPKDEAFAERCIDELISQRGNEVLLHLGIALEKAGDENAAAKMFERAHLNGVSQALQMLMQNVKSEKILAEYSEKYGIAFCTAYGKAISLLRNGSNKRCEMRAGKEPIPAGKTLKDLEAELWREAFKLFLEGANAGDIRSMAVVYASYVSGRGVEKNEEEARRWLGILAPKVVTKMDLAHVLYALEKDPSNAPLFGLDLNVRMQDEFKWEPVYEMAKLGNADALELLGNYVDDVRNGNEDEFSVKAVKLLEDDKKGDHAFPLFNFYLKLDDARAFGYAKTFWENSDSGRKNESIAYPLMLMRGIGCSADADAAFKLVENREDGSSGMLLAYMHFNGIGAEKNAGRAEEILMTVNEHRLQNCVYMFGLHWGNNIYLYPEDFAFAEFAAKIAAKRTGKTDLLSTLYLSKNAPTEDAQNGLNLLIEAAKTEPYKWRDVAKVYGDKKSGLMDAEKYFEALGNFINLNTDKALSEAIFQLGCCYVGGYGVEKDYAKAMEYFDRVVEMSKNFYENNTAFAHEMRAYCYELGGYGVERDADKARQIREEIIAKALPEIAKEWSYYPTRLFWIGNKYAPNGPVFEFPKDTAREIYWVSLAAKRDKMMLAFIRVYKLHTEFPKTRDWKAAAEFLKVYEDLDDKRCMEEWYSFRKGCLLLNGLGLEKDAPRGVALIERASELGNGFATEHMSYLYDKGIGVEKNSEKSREYLDKFFAGKDPQIWNRIRRIIKGAEGIADRERARFILQEAVKRGHARFQKDLDDFDALAERIYNEPDNQT